jgi:hypothetical protein
MWTLPQGVEDIKRAKPTRHGRIDGGHVATIRAFEIEIDHDGVLAASHDDGFTGFVRKSVDLLVRHIGRDVDEISRAGLAAKFQVVAPSHARAAESWER